MNTNSYAAPNAVNSYLKDAGFYYILWGVIVCLYCAAIYVSFTNELSNKTWVYSLFAIGGIVSFLRNKKSEQKQREEPIRVNKIFTYTWISTGIFLGLLWLSAPFIGILKIVPLSLLVYGLASLTTGNATKFAPSIIGSLVCLVCTAFAFNYDYATQHLIAIIGVCAVHIVPGIFMRRRA